MNHLLSRDRFDELWRALGAHSPGGDAYQNLRTAYDEPHRAYHTASHVVACLRLLDDDAIRALAMNASEVEAALWFHDAIYLPHRSDNEEASARLAEDCLGMAGVERARIARIASYIRATKTHTADTEDGQLVIDIDLSILGEAPEVFARFEAEIRREYAAVSDPDYAAGRTAVLRRFLERPNIYGAPLLRDRYEARARANLARAIANLGA